MPGSLYEPITFRSDCKLGMLLSVREGEAGRGDYLEALDPGQRPQLAEVNKPGLEALETTMAGHQGIAFLGAGASAPLYPLWDGVISELLDHASSWVGEKKTTQIRKAAREHPDAVVEIVRQHTGDRIYRRLLRETFRVRRDKDTGLTWTPLQEIIVRCPFAGVVTTNYDPGILNARIAARPGALSTSFTSWTDDAALDNWRTQDVFGDEELPILFAHGHQTQPDKMVFATKEYREAYRGKLGRVLQQIFDVRHVVWIGFSFADKRVAAILRAVGDESGSVFNPGQSPPRHVTLLAWDPHDRQAQDPAVMRSVMEIEFGCHAVFYPVIENDHSALLALLESFTDARFPPAGADGTPRPGRLVPAGEEPEPGQAQNAAGLRRGHPKQPEHTASGQGPVIQNWVHGSVPLEPFIGRAEELARLDRWARDPQTRLIGVTAWGGAGKTALVTEWLTRGGGTAQRPVRGLFAWSFYEANSGAEWALSLLDWVRDEFGVSSGHQELADQVLDVLMRLPVLLLMDGLEVLQEGQIGDQFGSLLDGNVRSVLTSLCQLSYTGLVVLTSRFPFADVEQFDGNSARMLDVPPFTPAEGAELLRVSGEWLPEQQRIDLVRAVDGHALAVGALAGALAAHPPASDLQALSRDLERASLTNRRVTKVLHFYADRLSAQDRMLVSIVAMFQRSVAVGAVLTLGESDVYSCALLGWAKADVERAVRQRLAGLLSWLPGEEISAHPLVREAFRATVLSADSAKMTSTVQLRGVPAGEATSAEHALRIVESIELLLEAGLWLEADNLYQLRTGGGDVWKKLPAARLGQRCGAIFVADEERRGACEEKLSPQRLSYYLNTAGIFGLYAGDPAASQPYLEASVAYCRKKENEQRPDLAVSLGNLSECLLYLGEAENARRAAAEASRIAADISYATEWSAASRPELIVTDAYLGAALCLAGETGRAEESFKAADARMLDARGVNLYSLWGIWWAELLLRTGRTRAAGDLAEQVTAVQRSNLGIARSNRLRGRCDLAGRPSEKELRSADARLQGAVKVFRRGDYLLELAQILPDLAEHRRQVSRLDEAELLCTDAITIASPRRLVPAHAAALARRALIRHDQYVLNRDAQLVERARDDADAALRLATAHRQLPWHELQALEAHKALDTVTGTDNGFAARLAALEKVLIPAGLEAYPLAVKRPGLRSPERTVAEPVVSAASEQQDKLPTVLYPDDLVGELLRKNIARFRRKPSRRDNGGRRPSVPPPPWADD
jgi:SIR2-like protein